MMIDIMKYKDIALKKRWSFYELLRFFYQMSSVSVNRVSLIYLFYLILRRLFR